MSLVDDSHAGGQLERHECCGYDCRQPRDEYGICRSSIHYGKDVPQTPGFTFQDAINFLEKVQDQW